MSELISVPDDPCPRLERCKPHLLNRRSAAARVGVTAGRFEQLIRQEVVPDPIIIGGGRYWDIVSLDRARDAVEQLGKAFVYAGRGIPEGQPQGEVGTASSGYCLPDHTWLQQRADLVTRVGRSFPSQNEISLLREFKLARSDRLSMYGCYRSFEALMARGYLVEVSRSGPSSRQLVTYELTESGAKVVASMKDA